ncbi:MAG: SDR family NAD(P)-dependent oxidoreductase [Pseudomonadota bacterium]
MTSDVPAGPSPDPSSAELPAWPRERGFLITGGAGDIGRATASLLLEAGAQVVLADQDRATLDHAVEGLAAAGSPGRLGAVACDVTRADDLARAVEVAAAMTGRLDGAFNAAGIIGPPFQGVAIAEPDWERVIAVNLTGAFLSVQAEMAAMRRAGNGGSIVNAASVAGLVGARLSVAYGAAKHGVVGLTRCAALDGAPDGIRVNAVCPNWTEGTMTEALRPAAPGRDLDGRMAGKTPLGRIGRPGDTAATVVWLLSPQSGYITGAAIPVDGGFTAA